MNIEELTLKEIREITALALQLGQSQTDPFWVPGRGYFIRTITHHYTGRLVRVSPTCLVLKDAAWIADDGRLSEALRTETFSEVEPYPDREVFIGMGAILDACAIQEVPRKLK